ncbi:LOW QUALITY PROTEIN: piggyBac transposable element-derived protein 4-like [Vespula maculifrons]|uniref:PiggyBac transposable element-derived protein 4-like n=1 Tax=Vespula maculifrons TaxID=7453 RepID=A0ABD2CUR7_VESMC
MNRFIGNNQNNYKPDMNLTVDEQLFPTKPDKFGIKFLLASDANSKYIIKNFPYLGKEESRSLSIPFGEFVVLKIVEPLTRCWKHVTTENNFFTSASLATKLLAKRITLLGTIRGNRRELPKLAKSAKDKVERFLTVLYKPNNCTLTIYKFKPSKNVTILTSNHKIKSITTESEPETVAYYNKIKFGIDVTDQMARKYSVKSKSYR